jgi:TrmH family RNA methyltransferase
MTRIAAPAVVLVRPQEEGNVGAAARAMANMGLSRLVLVEPAPVLGPTAHAFAVGAHPILAAVERFDSLDEALAPFQRIVGTTSSRQRQIEQRVLDARQLQGELAGDPAGTTTALVFGPEASGLSTDELALCDPLVTVPCSPSQPTLNLAQAVLIVSYELSLVEATLGVGTAAAPAAASDIAGLFDHLDSLFHQIGFARDDTYAAVIRDLRRLAARAQPTGREVQILRGVCRRALRAVSRDVRAASPGDPQAPTE